jgi:nucleoid DNA-binding protein
MAGVTKARLVAQITLEAGGELTRKGAEHLVDAVFAAVRDSIIRTGRFEWSDFGTLVRRSRKERDGRSPTGQPVRMPASVSVGFRPAPRFKKSL